jgi:Paraquat-inducible protein A
MTLGGRRFLLSLAIVAASVCLALGVSLPIIKLTKFVFFTYEHSLISTVNALIRSGQVFLGITVLIFSIFLPVLKLLYLLLLSTLPHRELRRLSRQLRALEWLGKWSMHDVLVLSLSIFFIKSQGVYDAKSLNGVYFFTAAVVFMILAYAWLRSDINASEPAAPVAKVPPATSTLRNFVFSFLIILATVFFALGVMLPAIRFTTIFVWTNQHSIATIPLHQRGILPVFRYFHVFNFFPISQAVLPAHPRDFAGYAPGVPRQVDLSHGMAWPLLHDRRHGPRLDDLLCECLWLHRSVGPARHLFLRRVDDHDHAGVRVGEFGDTGHRRAAALPAVAACRNLNARTTQTGLLSPRHTAGVRTRMPRQGACGDQRL